ncbi:MAG: hypothetical protein E6R03_02910 [Hyphomicrobiaceae bacterium]|nr:MAG: hypothetical protein E6R03_02910 [Hyphomicrobiaceae bacterium]
MDYSLFPILSKFERLTWRADNPNLGECRCPGHEDSTNSLHVTIKHCDDGVTKLMLKCHAGCQNADILRAMGEGFSSLFPDRTKQPKSQSAGKGGAASAGANGKADPKLVKVYDYHDANGKLLHQTLRWEPKHFTQRRIAEPNTVYQIKGQDRKSFRDPHGNWWINSLSGIEPVIYRLPEILKADPRKIIFLCEGEKDADNLRQKFGVYATTVPMGAGKWRPSYTATFRGRRVIIIPDTDKPRKGQTDPAANAGYDGARRVATELVKVALEVRICYLPNLFNLAPKWDLSDWLAAGGTKAQFLEACNEAPVLGINHPGLIPAGMTAAESESAMQTPPQAADADSSQLPAVIPPFTLDAFNQPLRGQIYNVIETADGFEPISMRGIMHQFRKVTDNWPKRVGKALFYVDKDNSIDPHFYPIQWLPSASSLFGWAGSYSGSPIAFAKTAGCHNKEEVFAEFQRTGEMYESVEQYPHEPRVPEVYYACKEQQEWVSTRPGCLYELVARFSPAEPVDYDLIIAFLATLVWGGPGGQRPLFVITSDSGRGAGKTTFASLLTSIVGGSLQLSSQADDQIIRQRLLSPEGMEKRTTLLDNVKSLKFSWAEFEALITSEKISGKQMYVGEASRVNRITYVITINGPSLSTDLAQRAITIKLGKPVHTGDWLADTAKFISENKTNIIAELLELLRQPIKPLQANTRWGNWETAVLCRLDNAERCQEVIRARQMALDAEQDESNLILEHFEKQLLKNNMRTDYDKILISSGTAAEWLCEALGEKHSKASAGRMLAQKINEGRLPRISKTENPERIDQSNRRERGFWWTPENWQEGGSVVRPGGLATFDVDELVAF